MLADSPCYTCKFLDSDGQACLACELVHKRAQSKQPLAAEDGLSEDESALLSELMLGGDLFNG